MGVAFVGMDMDRVGMVVMGMAARMVGMVVGMVVVSMVFMASMGVACRAILPMGSGSFRPVSQGHYLGQDVFRAYLFERILGP